ncbi:MAG: 3-deoxy-7-phosphoheptulonate synthase [Deltaproteobacteria bacterium]|jgi:3-deoxy-7-phosphoheptulonate synthase|nr:3-deoxy-7-phosphoheptulonate synthase [Deltaproteobacteria bacterium]MBW2534496.1 3-deoxy-7-phosphoheptulonate synthase [Deltaproteobacteria bacterium]
MSGARPHIVLVVLKADAAPGEVTDLLAQLGFDGRPHPRWRRFDPRLLAAWPERVSASSLDAIRARPSVVRVVHLEEDQRLFTNWPGRDPSLVELAPTVTVGERPLVIAGPCSLETEEQLTVTADAVAEAGGAALRCGLFKPRTSPYSYGGLGEQGLELLDRVRERTGLPIATEVLDSAGLEAAAPHLDVVQIGSRNMHNTSLLFRAGAHPLGKPILLKRGFGATVDELVHAAEYVLLGRLAAGHERADLILCERGIRTFDGTTRFTLNVAAVVALRQRTALPIIVDPSHAAGDRNFVLPLARAALASGAQGLLVEVHPEPTCAWCDGAQGITFESFRALMDDVRSSSRELTSI